ncbi:hypothetical protein [Mediterraneibacter agrestimuris]|uniref:hypothetical protein n=1 Tax=Mediterraneibacter agrestimuris TaxID=2941333 RepID=UPI0020416551|nr:hypothetical protein [Mediterraneibacter agrestimuris]
MKYVFTLSEEGTTTVQELQEIEETDSETILKYVVECLDIDDVVIWKNQKGEIYQTVPTNKVKLISNSIAEYLA